MMQIESWLRIYLTKNVGPITFKSLYKKYLNPEIILQKICMNNKYEIPSIDKIRLHTAKLQDFGAQYLFFQDIKYPRNLKQVYDAPAFLFIKGNIDLLNHNKIIAIVGARNSSIHGNKIAYTFAQGMYQNEYAVISGMARGIDRNAHIGSIKQTMAVFGSGLDVVYPETNCDVYHDILSNNGLHISEFPLGTKPSPSTFPSRNRIIAGISDAVLIIEASQKSGSLITANYALEYNRDVFVIPGSPLDVRSRGSNALIQNGACLVQDYQEICSWIDLWKYKTYKMNHNTSNNIDDETENICNIENNTHIIQKKILDLLGHNSAHIDMISAAIDLQPSILRQMLSTMEIEGLIMQEHPNVFSVI